MSTKRVSVVVTGDAAGAVRSFEEVGAAAEEAARVATEAGDKVAAAAVRQADVAAQAAERAAKTAATESQAAADAFAEGNTAAYERAAAAADAAAKKAEAAWAKADAAAVRAAQEAADAQGTAAEEAAAKAAEAAKASSVAARGQWDMAKTASRDAATVAEEDAGRFGTAMEGAATKTGGLFQKLGGTLGNWGIPFGESISKVGEKFAEAKTHGQKFTAALSEIGKVASVAGVAGFAVVGAESVKMATEFQSSMTQLVTGAGESQKAIGQVSDGILSMAGAVGTAPQELAKGMYLVESAGFHGAAGLKVLKAAAEGAKVGGADLSTVADAVTSALNAYGLKASDAASMTSQLVATTAAGKMHMQDLAGALSAVLPMAAAAHLSFSQVGGAIATMTGQGMSAQQAAQDLAHTIGALQNPNSVAVGEMEQLGLKADDVELSLGKRGLTGTIGMLTEAITSKMGPSGTVILNAFNQSQSAANDLQVMLKAMPPNVRKLADEFMSGALNMTQFRKAIPTNDMGMVQQFTAAYEKVHGFNSVLKALGPAGQTYTAALSKMMGGQTGLNTALFLSSKHADAFAANVASVGSAAVSGATQVQGFSTVQKDFAFQLEQAKASAEALGIRLGDALIPKIQEVISVVGDVVSWFEKNSGAAKALALVVGSVLTAAVGAFAAEMAGNFIMSLVRGVSSIAGFVAGLFGMRAAQEETAATMTETAAVSEETGGGFGPIGMAIGVLVPLLYELVTHWKTIWADIRAVAEAAWQFLDGIWQSIDTDLRHWWGDVEDFFKALWQRIDTDLRHWWGDVESFFEGLWQSIESTLRVAWDATADFFDALWQRIDNGIHNEWNAIAEFFSAVWNGIATAVRDIWNALKAFLDDEWNGWVSIVSTVWGSITGAVTAVWDTVFGAKGVVGSAWSAIKSFLNDEWNGWVSIVSAVWGSITGAIITAWDTVTTAVTKVWSDIKSGFTTGVNDVIKIINDFIGVLNHIPFVHISPIGLIGGTGGGGMPPAAAGGSNTAVAGPHGMAKAETGMRIGGGFMTNGPQVLVGEGNPAHPEYVIPTDPQHRSNAHSLLAGLLGDIGMPKLAGGGILGGLGSIVGSVGGAIGGAASDVGGAISSGLSDLAGLAGQALAAAAGPVIDGAASIARTALGVIPQPVKGVGDWGVSKIADGLKSFLAGTSAGPGNGGSSAIPSGAHLQLIRSALGLAGVPDNSGNESAVNQIVLHESGWNPNAINNWDSNAKAGDPSRGLMQTIMSTFKAYALPGYDSNIYDPISNLVAGIRYAVSRYGSLEAVPGVAALASGGSYVGYDTGGLLRPGGTMAMNFTGSDEFVFTPSQVQAMARIGVGGGAGQSSAGGVPVVYSPVLNISGVSDATVAARVRQELDAHDRQLVSMLQGM